MADTQFDVIAVQRPGGETWTAMIASDCPDALRKLGVQLAEWVQDDDLDFDGKDANLMFNRAKAMRAPSVPRRLYPAG